MDDSATLPLSNLRRRNSISTPIVVPSNLSFSTIPPVTKPLYSSSFPNQNGIVSPPPQPLDLELVSFKNSLAYTSLRDLIPSSPGGLIHSPTAASAVNSGYEISIRNRLVKQAAWAYLQPMSSSPGSVGTNFFHRLWLRLSAQNPLSTCLGFFNRHLIPTLTRVFDRILRVFGVRAAR